MARRITHPTRPSVGDIVAGIGVGLVLIPQSIAYAEIARLPPEVGLFAAALPPLLAAFFVSSPYLQTGPVALTSLLTFGALSGIALEGSAEWIDDAILLALLVGIVRIVLGLARAGWLVYLMTAPVLLGFTSAAAVLIAASQFPKSVGFDASGSTLGRFGRSLAHVADWSPTAVMLSAGSLAIILLGRKLHRLFPGVLVVVIVGVIFGALADKPGVVIGDIPTGFPSLGLDLRWENTGQLLVPAIVVALVGFAEVASISQTFAAEDDVPWDANKDFISQGVANVVSGVSGGLPIGGSFSRSSLNRLAGASSPWSGAITGLTVIAFLPVAFLLEDLPQAVLGGIVISAVLSLMKPRELARVWKRGWIDAALAWGTFGATLLLAPRVDLGVATGIALAIIVRLVRKEELVPRPGRGTH